MASSTKTSPPREEFLSLYLDICRVKRWAHHEMARELEISGKTLARYVAGHRLPAVRARDIVRRLAGIDPALHARVAACLGVPIPTPVPVESPRVHTPADPGRAKSILDAAVLEASDQQNLPPGTTRAVGRILLEAIHHAGLDVLTARELLAVKSKRA